MNIQILASARNDLIDGFRFHAEKDIGLGNYFLASLFSDIEALKILAGIHSKSHDKFHRSLSKRFPYAIYYTIENDVAIIHAVVDCRRAPSWIRNHLTIPEQSEADNQHSGDA